VRSHRCDSDRRQHVLWGEGAELAVRFFHEEGDGAKAWRGSDKAHDENKY
jgi:hypothetical protein